ncbi:pleckstrin homology domain-containing family G member 3 [Megalops cyprinoides]|uniref:pleckstrin homology domain-containing family G member 3 n=1 Tax=Megalops cyprinoides TaxID=118141 RepID=UPI001865667E|nr:pleckstrin homology domain-containing family G member 3 [Megalops cyprinoides]
MPEGSHSTSYEVPMGEESPRLSTASSVSSNERMSTATVSDCSASLGTDLQDGERPVSLVSTLSSGSSRDGQSLYGSTAALPDAPPSTGDDIDLELSPAGGAREQQEQEQHTDPGERRRRGLAFHQCNNNNAAAPNSGEGTHQASVSPFAAKAMAPNPKLTYVDRVVMEIIETERMYVRDLRSIVEDYLAHIIDTSDLPIKPEQVCALFGNIEDIYEFNSELLQSLDMCENDPVAIARCFVDKSEYFEIYTQYCTNYPNSVAALTDCMRSKALAKFFRDRQASLKRSLPLGSYLLKPVQRILKYHLLLQEIAKHFDPQEEGYEVVEEAIDTMTGVAWYINDMKRKHEHAVRLQEVQSLLINWKGPDLTTYGELVLEGTFRVHRAKNERTLFLFDKMLLITKKRGEHYVYKTHISCSTLMLIESTKDSLCFSVTHFKHPKQPHTVQAKTVEEKRLWAHHIKRLILENHHAIIPQKAKEAILEMDSIYPSKYRYSPERLKKAVSCQSDDFPGGGRQGRRQSEPAKQIIKSTKAILKDEDGCDVTEENGLKSESSQSPGQNEIYETENGSSAAEQAPEEWLHPQPGAREEDIPSDSEPVAMATMPVDSHQDLEMSEPEKEQQEDEEEEEKEKEEKVEEPIIPQQEQVKGLTSGESSEDEEEEEEGAAPEMEPSSILPPSVLDQASVIAERFVSSLSRRSSLIADDARSPSCPSPRLGSRSGSALSLNAEAQDKTQRLNSASSEPPLILLHQDSAASGTDPTVLSPSSDNLFEVDRGSQRRRDSTLSKKDRLLIDKIRSYYEHAEHQDANFSIKRRESLSYIPAGLVRNLSSRLNSIPKNEAVAAEKKAVPSVRPASWMVFNLPGMDKAEKTTSSESDADMTVDGQKSKPVSLSLSDIPISDEEFRPSSEMIKVWQDMEEKVSRSPAEAQSSLNTREDAPCRGASPSLSRKGQSGNGKPAGEYSEPLMILEECDLSTISEESSIPSPVKASPGREVGLGRAGSLNETHRSQQEGRVSRAPIPRVISLRADVEEDLLLQDMEKMKNKVFQLARQYSQRIKNSRPIVKQRARETESYFIKRNLPSVQEEREDRGKSNLTLSLSPYDQVVLQELKSPSPVHTPRSVSSPRVLSPSLQHSKSPLSPALTESFNWPDVRELRSKYAPRSPDSAPPRPSPVSRSCSVPEKMLESDPAGPSATWRHSSYSPSSSCYSPLDTKAEPTSPSESPVYKPHLNMASGEGEGRPGYLCRSGSLDHRLNALDMNELNRIQDNNTNSSYYISGQASLPNQHKVIVMEKLAAAESWRKEKEGKREMEVKEEADENYVQIRSPTSHEKISIMAVIDRCKAYQESDEYRQREESGAKADQDSRSRKEIDQSRGSLPNDLDTSQKSVVNSGKKIESSQHSLVKNLREKFQNLSSNTL